ncbi:hypothetical protein K458DRAFT_410459 [Lentithecium fluviatile CBS 122367]|uniref:Major facilitator superfamily (MFS) profile domain-containing protein n=1 Tax=Lentithecium fluviatile CBS 122367 TaxID=1168545 RepID=A0A6G1IEH5_9PLEO|nr:hypothetical protein K458DRAFT_410459 [Lentithecium fluviatile CBS 122367]
MSVYTTSFQSKSTPFHPTRPDPCATTIISTDLLFNVGNLVITANFLDKSQALAGSVFNTVAQLGNSIGLAVTAIIAAAVSDAAERGGRTNSYALLKGNRSGFWTCFAAAVVSVLISSVGLRKARESREEERTIAQGMPCT